MALGCKGNIVFFLGDGGFGKDVKDVKEGCHNVQASIRMQHICFDVDITQCHIKIE
jgi:hypothetical protein